MSKTCKKLLASALAVTMLFSACVSALVVSAATIGTLGIASEAITEGTTEAKVDLTFTYTAEGGVEAPHKFITLTSEFALKDVVLKSVNDSSDYGTQFDGEGEDMVCTNPWPAYIEADGADFANGKFLIETDAQNPVKFTKLVLTATYTIPAETVVGSYAVTVNASATDYEETDYEDLEATGSIIVEAAHKCEAGTPVSNDNGTHDIPCAGCDKLVADDEACTYENGVCTVCGYAEPVTHEHEYVTYSYVDTTNHTVACACGDVKTEAHVYTDSMCPCGVNEPKSEVKGFSFYNPVYDAENNILMINYSAVEQELRDANSAASAAGDRWRGLILTVGTTDHPFEVGYVAAGKYFNITGLAFTDMNELMTVKYVIKSEKANINYETDSFKIRVIDFLKNTAGDNEKINQLLELEEASKTAESVNVTPVLSETKGIPFTTVSYNPAECTLMVNYDAVAQELRDANSEASAAGDRWRGLIVTIGTTTYPFEVGYVAAGKHFVITGLANSDICETITVSYLIESNNAGIKYETGSVTVDVKSAILSSGTDFADKFNAFLL